MSIPRPEHPMPQFMRKDWVNLNGTWSFEMDFSDSGLEQGFFARKDLKDEILVPFCPESELSGIGFTDFIPAVWYKREITVSKEQLGGCVKLHFGAVDYASKVYINGHLAGEHEGGYSSFAFDITAYLEVGSNDLIVYARDDVRSGGQPSGKQSPRYENFGCMYTRSTGIWQTVWVEFMPVNHIEKVWYYPNIEEGTVTIKAQVKGRERLIVEAFYENKACGKVEATGAGDIISMTLKLDEIHLWELGVGNLYDLKLTYGDDVIESYFGLREVRMDGYKFMLNNRSVFQRLVLDQGYYPKGIYTAETEEELVRDIHLSMELGFNGARLHEKVFESRFLYHCDRLGYMVWGEFANWGTDHSTYEGLHHFLPEWMEVLERDFNHPAIIGWCPYNETWDWNGRQQIASNLGIVYEMTKHYDPTRPCIDTSGNFHVKTDIYDLHNYVQEVEVFRGHYAELEEHNRFHDDHAGRQNYKKGQPVFVSEYGGIKWEIGDKMAEGWGYGDAPTTEEEFIERYRGLTDVLLDNPKMCAYCYTQLYDVMQEVNGLYTYERVPKFVKKVIYEINSRKAAIED